MSRSKLSWAAIAARAAVATTVVASGASACTTVANEPDPTAIAKLDETAFACGAEPVLVRQCSFNACHGNAGAALRIYSVGKLRAVPPANADDAAQPLTAAEHHANFQSASGFSFDIDDPVDNWLLRKPLPASLGGYEHKGGAIYKSTTDADYAAVLAWLKGAKQCN